MIEADSNHFQIVKDSITGERTVDEQTFASVTILAERLERLRALGDNFSSVDFSPAVKKLIRQNRPVAVA